MPDPTVVYIVTSVVVVGLIAWVIIVLLRPDKAPSPGAPALTSGVGAPAAMSGAGAPPSSADRPHRLDSHAEIRDEPVAAQAPETNARSPR